VARKVEVIVGLVDKTGKGAKSAMSSIDGIAKKGALLGVGAVAGVAALSAGVFALASNAEPLVGVGKAFEGITADFDGGSAEMLKALQAGGAGLVTNTDLMKTFNKATQLVSVDFGKKLPDAMGMVGKVAAATGQDMGYLLDSLTVGIGRMSPMILDNLGIQVSLSEANEAYAQTLGKTTGELTKAEQQTALMTQVMDKLATNTANMPDIDAPFAQLKTTMKNLYEDGIQRLFIALKPLADKLVAFTTTILPPIIAAFDSFFQYMRDGTPFLVNLQTLFIKLGVIFGVSAERMREIAAGLRAFIDGIIAFLEPVISFITENVKLKDVLIAFGIILMSIVIPAIISVITAILPIIALFAVVIAAVAAMRWAWENNFMGIQEKTQAVITFISNLIQTVMTFIQEFWAANGDAILAKAQQIWETIKTAISVAITVISAIITVTMAAIQAFWIAHGDAILAKAKAIWAAILSAITAFIGLVQDIIVSVATYLQGFWERHGEALLAGATKAWDHIKTAIGLAFDYIQVLFEAFAALFTGDWETLGNKINELWQLTISMIVEVISGLWSLISPILGGFWSDFKGWFSGKNWKAIGKNIIDGIKEGVKNAARALASAVVDAVKGAIDAAKRAAGISSPSTVFMEIGHNMGRGLALGMAGKSSMIGGAAAGMATAAISGSSAITNATTNNYYLTAKYGNQSPSSLTQDVRLMEMLAAV